MNMHDPIMLLLLMLIPLIVLGIFQIKHTKLVRSTGCDGGDDLRGNFLSRCSCWGGDDDRFAFDHHRQRASLGRPR